MSGDVQPRKRKDKKKKKDDLGVEEPRGTAATLGEGDVFIHSHSEHSTGGHWCAKVIFFSLLAVLITLIGLIILENRGLTELEANSVESRYSGVLEGWIEEVPDDDHHDEHTLELKHHDEDNGDQSSDLEHDDDHDDDDENDEHENHDDDDDDENDNEDDEHENDDGDDDENDEDEAEPNADDSEEADNAEDEENQESEERNLDTTEDEDDIEEASFKKYYENNEKANVEDDDDDDDDLKKESEENYDDNDDEIDHHNDDDDDEGEADYNQEADDDDDNDKDDDDDVDTHQNDEDEKTLENDYNNDSEENEDYLQNNAARDNEDEEEHEDDDEEEEAANVEVEAIEKEVSDDDAASDEAPAASDDEDDQSQDVSEELPLEDDTSVEDDVEFLEPDELDELPIVEPITAPKGKPLAEVGESPSTDKPQDTLADEEEYERQQEQLRKEKEQTSQGMWLKLTVGGALLVATHAVLRRATASRETDIEEDEPEFREETPLSDRRMTLISDPVPPPTAQPKLQELSRPIEKEATKEAQLVNVQTSPPTKEDLEEEEEEIIVSKQIQPIATTKDIINRELYSDEEDVEEEEEEIIEPTKANPQQAVPQVPQIPDVTKEVTPEPDEDDDVEIIDEEQLEEEMEEEEISDVDDAELLNRLEAKYGRLPEPERPARTHKDGGNSIEDEWPGEPEDAFWNEHLEQAQRELRQGEWTAAVEKASTPKLQSSARARYIIARALDAAADAKKDNQLLSRAISAYLELLKMNERLSDKKLLEVATRTLDRIKFRGTYLSAEPVYKLLIRRFPDEPTYRNNLTIALLMANRADLAENVLKETLKLWPNDRLALAHLGFILKTLHNRLEEAVEAFTKALEGDTGAANEPRFYYHLGDALLLLGRFDEAHEIHKRGAKLGHFLSPNQRSLYNVDRLQSKPWWNVHQTPYSRIARALEKSWKEILKEGEAARVLYEKEKEGLKERGEWSQLDLFVRGREVPERCSRAPVTCGIVKGEVGASGCRRGQVKFSMMEAGTHVRPHVGPTNCRLRMHLGLTNTKDTFIRVDKETRQWQIGKVLMFDDSFEHEVWHNGTGARLVLIVDVWHPDLTPAERRQLPAI